MQYTYMEAYQDHQRINGLQKGQSASKGSKRTTRYTIFKNDTLEKVFMIRESYCNGTNLDGLSEYIGLPHEMLIFGDE